jgi:hypothetical protein
VFFEQRPAFFGQPFIDYIHIDGQPTGAAEAQNIGRSSAAVATTREGQRSLRSGRAGQPRRCDQVLVPVEHSRFQG